MKDQDRRRVDELIWVKTPFTREELDACDVELWVTSDTPSPTGGEVKTTIRGKVSCIVSEITDDKSIEITINKNQLKMSGERIYLNQRSTDTLKKTDSGFKAYFLK